MAAEDDDGVGYGKPPKAHRFEKGRSGNPRGRPKKANSQRVHQTVLEQVLGEKVLMTANGKSKKVTIAKATAYRMVELAARGNASAARFLVAAQSQIEAAAVPTPPPDPDSEIVTSLMVDMLSVVEVLLAADVLYLRRSGGLVFERASLPQFFTNCGPEFMARSKDLTFVVSDREHDPEAVLWPGDEPLLDVYERLARGRKAA